MAGSLPDAPRRAEGRDDGASFRLTGVKQRARTDEDKESRRADILEAARWVFDEVEADEFTMDAVAASLGLAKGTLYRYVPTREALLLSLALDEYIAWFDEFDAALTGMPASSDVAVTIAGAMTDSLLARPRFLRLASLIASVLERNVPLETARSFKGCIIERSARTATLVSDRLGCTASDAKRVLVLTQALTVGLHHHAHPAPVVAEVLADAAFAAARIDFGADLRFGIEALFRATIV
jgi:AcrR family transcriptional regulator